MPRRVAASAPWPGQTLLACHCAPVGTGRSSNLPSLGHLGGVHFRSLQEQLDTVTSGGELVFHVFGALGEFERDLIRERTMAALAAAELEAGGLEGVG